MEAEGWYPGDGSNGSNGSNVPSQRGVVRCDIRSSVQSLARTSLTSDMVVRDGYQRQVAAISGIVSSGVEAGLAVPVR